MDTRHSSRTSQRQDADLKTRAGGRPPAARTHSALPADSTRDGATVPTMQRMLLRLLRVIVCAPGARRPGGGMDGA